MSRKVSFLPLPGISVRDPNFYDGADYQDRSRFAQPSNPNPVPRTPEPARPRVIVENPSDEIPRTAFPTGTNPRPFKLKG